MSASKRPFRQAQTSSRFSGAALSALLLLFCLWGIAFRVEPAAARPEPVNLLPSPSEVITAVNQVRAGRGLPPYQANPALMAAAQAHSEFMASIGSTSHTGAGGSSVLQRAVAAGYGGGAAVSVIENVWGGGKGSAQQAVNWWVGDSLHLSTLISTRHTDVGAGVASTGSATYYTLDVGVITGAPGSAETQIAWSTQATGQPGSAGPPATAGPVFNPIQVATPGPDGAVIHVVEPGQTVWTIAATYKVSLADVLRINGLNANSSFIVPGQKLVIQPPGSMPTATFALLNAEGTPIEPAVSASPEPERPTRTPKSSPTAVAQRSDENIEAGAVPSPPVGTLAQTRRVRIDPVLLVIGAFLAGGLALVLAGTVLKRSD